MYIPKAFREDDVKKLHKLIESLALKSGSRAWKVNSK
jgi:predicted FMN-binding regulatory protein PaiB